MIYSQFSNIYAGFRIVSGINYDTGACNSYFNVDVSGIWEGKVLAPVTGTYTFSCYLDDQCFVYVGGQLITFGSCCGWISGTIALTAGTYYDLFVVFS